MRFLAIVEQGARAYPALLPLALVSIALTLWACEHRRWLWAAATSLLGFMVCLLYIGSPALATARPEGHGPAALAGRMGKEATLGAARVPTVSGRKSSKVRLHPRFPHDFPIPRAFRLESNSGDARAGNLSVRFRFSGEAANAVCDLRVQGRSKGWAVEVLAPHRMIFRKDGRLVESWFSYPARSVVLDIPDNR